MANRMVDPSTGEIRAVLEVPEGTRSVYFTPKSKNPSRNDTNLKNWRDQRKFFKSFANAWKSAFHHRLFTPQESHMLLFLGAYCEAESNGVITDEGRMMSTQEIAEGIGWSERNTRRLLTTLQAKNAVFYGGSPAKFFVNPILFGNGAVVNRTTERMFEDEKQKRLDDAKGMLSFLRIGRTESTLVAPREVFEKQL